MILADERWDGARTRPVCLQLSDWPCNLEIDNSVHLGFCGVNGLNHLRGEALVHARRERFYRSLHSLLARVTLNQDERRTPAAPGACDSFGGHRRDALWQVENPLPLDVDRFAQAEPAATTPRRCRRRTAPNDSRRTSTGRT